MKYDFDQMIDRFPTESSKWHAYEADVLPMFVADMDFVSPQPVIQALQKRVAHGVFGYPKVDALDLRRIIVERMARLYSWEVKQEDILIIPGVVTGVHLACHTLAAANDGVLVQTPVYTPILHAARTTGFTSQEMELTREPDGCYTINQQAFNDAITPTTKLFILCNPHNPIGRVYTRKELEFMAGVCLRHGITICSDEIHCDLVYEGYRHIPIASLDQEVGQHTITLIAPSKTYNMAGLNCSIAIIPNPELRKKFLHSSRGLLSGVNLLGLIAAQAAYRDGQEWLEQLLAYLQANRDYLSRYVAEQLPGVQMTVTEGTYLAWLDCRATVAGKDPYRFFVNQAKVAFNDGASFGKGGEGFVRLNFGCPRQTLREGLERIKAALFP